MTVKDQQRKDPSVVSARMDSVRGRQCGPSLYRPRSPLADHVEFFGHWQSRETGHRSRALPRGAVTVVFDLGQRQQLDFYTADGCTRLAVPPAVVIGSHAAPYLADIAADEPAMVAARFGILEDFLLERARFTVRRHPAVAAALAALEANPSLRISGLGRRAGLPAKRMIALFRAEVGMAPKAYARVRRLQAALRHLQAGTADGSRIAADAGYFDQSHFVREFRSFTAMTPTQYGRQRLVLPSHVPIDGRKYPIPSASASA